jgi:hypothetical protein
VAYVVGYRLRPPEGSFLKLLRRRELTFKKLACATDEIEGMGREIESRRGICRVVALIKSLKHFKLFAFLIFTFFTALSL